MRIGMTWLFIFAGLLLMPMLGFGQTSTTPTSSTNSSLACLADQIADPFEQFFGINDSWLDSQCVSDKDPNPKPVKMPEFWGLSELLGFLALVVAISWAMVRLKLLRLSYRADGFKS